MASQNWVSLLNPGIFASGPGASLTLAASTQVASPVTGVANQDIAVIQAHGQYLGWQVGMLIRITARGFYTSTSTTGTLTYKLFYNKGNATAAASQTAILTSAGITTPSSALTGFQWKLEALVRCTAIATSGNTVAAQGELIIGNNVTSPTMNVAAGSLVNDVALWVPMPNITGETATAVDTTQLAGLNLQVTGTAAQGTLQCTQWLVEAMD
jgi:hypothetical protein